MKKKLTSIITAAALIAGCTGALAADIPDKVEIAFKVGDSTLSINGVPTTVETPYVAGEGTTLVPLRVITEAFGADVQWNGENQTITLTYPEVNVVLTIGSRIAAVNSHSETLLEPPVLSPNGVTMVPLRFLSETFGAEVGYDADTQSITVTKEKAEDGSTVEGITELAKIGDSAYGWSMDTPVSLTMTDRSFGGLSTVFENETSSIYIDVDYNDADQTPDSYLEDMKDFISLCNGTLSKSSKTEKDAAGNTCVVVQGKDSNDYMDMRVYYAGDYSFYVSSYVSVSADASEKAKITSYLDSFKASAFPSDGVHDLSGLDNSGMRTFKDDKYAVSFTLPKGWVGEDDDLPENEFSFVTFTKPAADGEDAPATSAINLAIYSKSDMSAKQMADSDFDNNTRYYNQEFITTEPVSEYSMAGVTGYKYSLTVNTGSKRTLTDIFFEKGDYTYNLSFHLTDENKSVMDTVIKSFKADTIDSEKVGTIIRNTADTSIEKTVKTSGFSLKAPGSWDSLKASNGILLFNGSCGAILTVTNLGKSSGIKSSNDISSFVSQHISEYKKNDGVEIVSGSKSQTINNSKWYTFTAAHKSDDGKTSYETCWFGLIDGNMFCCILSESEATYGAKTADDLLKIIESIKLS